MDLIIGGKKIHNCDPIEHLKQQDRNFILIDNDPNTTAAKKHNLKRTKNINKTGQNFIQGDIDTALKIIIDHKPEYVYPTEPIHIIPELLKTKYKLKKWPEGINLILPYLPQAIILRAGNGELVLSYNRDKNCNLNCNYKQSNKPPKTCPITRKRPCTMQNLMRYACPQGFVLFSHTRAPGIGAFKGKEILDLFDWTRTKEKFVVGTSCTCHGIFWSFKKDI